MNVQQNLSFHLQVSEHQFTERDIAPGVSRAGYIWGAVFEGKQDALVAAGVALSEWFNDGTQRNKRGYVKRQKVLTYAGRKIKTRAPAQGNCLVFVDYLPDELEAAQDAHEANREQADEGVSLDALINSVSAGDYKPQELAQQSLNAGILVICRAFNTGGLSEIPWNSSREVIEQVQGLCAELYSLLSDNPVRPAKILKARADRSFQGFMQKLNPPNPLH